MISRLKNTGITYQSLMNKIFIPLIGNIIEVLIDDMITESTELNEKVQDLEESSTYFWSELRQVFRVYSKPHMDRGKS